MKHIIFDCDNTMGIFFRNLNELVVMGTITEIINGRHLNFSCNIRAAGTMLEQAMPLSIITGNNCLAAFFSHKEFQEQLVSPKGRYVYSKTKYWFDKNIEQFGARIYWRYLSTSFESESAGSL